MSDAIIRVENLGKKYRIQHQAGRPRYVALRDVIAQKLKAPFQFLRRSKMADGSSGQSPISQLPTPRASKTEDFWALKGVSFEVRQGEVVGIIGRNGAGKSTLLKILSRITDPTEGRVRIKGRVASLLEVGTGFHPELTGRENIFLNGAILGMHRSEIKQKFDEIVAFAEVEKFLDTPVKRYSSGMYVRLAFAVAAHLEPEILIVDEVLAVGDAEFQKKCLGKMESVSRSEGRTVLFVSHNMDAIIRLCSKAVILNKGDAVFEGHPAKAAQHYLDSFSQFSRPGAWFDLTLCKRQAGDGRAIFQAAAFEAGSAYSNFWPESDGAVLFKLRVLSDEPRMVTSMAVAIYGLFSARLVNADSLLLKKEIHLKKGENEVHLNIEQLHLKPGNYTVGFWLANGANQVFDFIESAFEINVVGKDGRLGSEIGKHDGSVTCKFTISQVASGGS